MSALKTADDRHFVDATCMHMCHRHEERAKGGVSVLSSKEIHIVLYNVLCKELSMAVWFAGTFL